MSYKIIDLPALGRPFNATDIIEVSDDGTGSYKANIGNFTLGGTNYIFVNANGTYAENGAAVKAAYTAAQAMTPNGVAKSATNRVVILLSPGYYTFNEAVDGAFTVNTSFIDFESLSGVPDVYFSSMQILSTGATGINVRMSGIDTSRNSYYGHGAFAIAAQGGSAESLYIKDCVGGQYSFGSYSSSIKGTFDSCVAGANSFGYTANIAPIGVISVTGGNIDFYGTFKNCSAGNYSFLSSQATITATVTNYGTIDNCKASDYSFIYSQENTYNYGNIYYCNSGSYSFSCSYNPTSTTASSDNSGVISNCIGGTNSFASTTALTASFGAVNQGTIINCSGNNSSFASQSNLLSGLNFGTIMNCDAISSSRCFMGEVGLNSGLISGCVTNASAFCCNTSTNILGDILRCTMTGDTFTSGVTGGGRVILGIDTTGIVNY